MLGAGQRENHKQKGSFLQAFSLYHDEGLSKKSSITLVLGNLFNRVDIGFIKNGGGKVNHDPSNSCVRQPATVD